MCFFTVIFRLILSYIKSNNYVTLIKILFEIKDKTQALENSMPMGNSDSCPLTAVNGFLSRINLSTNVTTLHV